MADVTSSNSDLVIPILGLIIYVQVCSFLYSFARKLALPNVLKAADVNQARTLELLRRGVGVIPLDEHKALLSRYLKLAEFRDKVAGYRLRPLAGWNSGVRNWLGTVRGLREATESIFERYEREDIATVLDGDARKLV
ncbi:hypothetical protein K466DRAFT_659075 [Polyporus arcularius HHB13444]|uniref:Uncharacterized protein n=1 Tax=Polyporus arcularius HHB13444 TaxID=1314778 RepID=A0A5C3PW94_9APHY|nr:hypothetical protein K466DRAFT_659075 [Polyporus arcularius HHB13444]